MSSSSEPVHIFTIVLIVILMAPILVSRLRIPGLIGLILAGAIIGPNALGILQRDATMNLLGTIGLLFIMFIAGLGIDLNQFQKSRRSSLLFGNLTFWAPMLLGCAMGRFMMGYTWPVSILLGGVFSSHTLLPYSIVSKLGLSKSRAVTATIGGTLFTDIGAMMVLAVVAASVSGTAGAVFWFRLFFLVAAYFSLTLWLVPKIGRWFLRHVAENGEVEFIFVLAVLFVCAYCSILVGLEPIIGAFLAGLSLNRLIPEGSTLMNRVQFVGNALFIPFFLIATGMIIDASILQGGAAWRVTLTMLAIIFPTKWFAAWASAKLLGFTRDEGNMMFGLSINQAAATLASVLVGHRLGLFGEELLTGTIIMVGLTCLFGAWYTDVFARRVALDDKVSPRADEMPERIMAAIGNPKNAEGLVEMSMLIRKKASGEAIYFLSVVQDGADSAHIVSNAERVIAQVSAQAVAAAVPVVPVTRLDTNIAEGLLSAVKDCRISVIVAGWNGKSHGLGNTFGKTIDEVVDRSTQTVLIAHLKSKLTATRSVILAISPSSEKRVGFSAAIHVIKLIAFQLGAPIRIITVSSSVSVAEKRIHEIQPEVPVFYSHTIPRWRDLPAILASSVTLNDLVIILSPRSGELAWHPFMHRLPDVLATTLPDANFAFLYPSLAKTSGTVEGDQESVDNADAHPYATGRIRLDLDGMTLAESVRTLVGGHLSAGAVATEEAMTLIERMINDGPLELDTDILLFHAHVPALAAPSVFVGVNHSGFVLGTATFPIIVLLLSPKEGTPEEHLRSLSAIATTMRGPVPGMLLSAASPEAAAAFLNGSTA